MKINTIVYKLFGMTLVFFIVLLGCSSLIESLFLEEFYINKKMETVRNDIEIFSADYLKENWTLKETIEKVDLFIEKNNSPMILVDDTGKIKNNNKYGDNLIIRTEVGEFYTAHLSELIDHTNFKPGIGDKIKINGTVLGEEKRFRDVLKIDSSGEKYYDTELIKCVYRDLNNNKFPRNLDIIEVRGEIVYINNRANSKENEYISYKNSVLIKEIENVFLTNKFSINDVKDDYILNYEVIDPNTNNRNRIFIKPFIEDDGKKLFACVITSLQPINEAIDIIEEFNIYVFIFALIFTIILAFIYSKMITSPLLEINRVAEKMANLDFSVKCKIDSKDELGNLSKNINTMSTNLSNSLENLKRANEKLVDDIENERRQEEKRRRFIADVSHELKTPLGIMRGFAEGIKEGVDESNKDYYLDVIIDEIEKMDAFVIDMITISKLQDVGYKLSMKEFYIDDLTNGVMEKYIHILHEKNIKISCLCEHLKVYGDEAKICQVIDNFLSNAVKYSELGERINIRIEEDGELIFFYIENTGAHIPESEIDKIWDRFYRVEHSRSRLYGGTGLGLNIVKNILELHESRYGLRNTKDGVEFYFTLPKTD
ncbi:MAG: HAMP domain-containing histidine kinase [Maledivibacter sp.]|jgi:signal transduction histidine kinase|nr:HAMP domain-containing histidine kinase [Maledivibacter sp.]